MSLSSSSSVALTVPASVRFLSVEPLLKAVDLSRYLDGVQWVIVGGESGPRTRPMAAGVGQKRAGRLSGGWRPVLLQAVGRSPRKGRRAGAGRRNVEPDAKEVRVKC